MLELRVLSPIAKVFPLDAPAPCAPRFTGLLNEIVSFQIAYRLPEGTPARPHLRLEIASPVPLRARRVKYMPVRMAALPDCERSAPSWLLQISMLYICPVYQEPSMAARP